MSGNAPMPGRPAWEIGCVEALIGRRVRRLEIQPAALQGTLGIGSKREAAVLPAAVSSRLTGSGRE